MLEACDYYSWSRDRQLLLRLLLRMAEVVRHILQHKDKEHWLFRTGETPADDKVDYPFHFSSQVLVWHTFNQLHELNKEHRFIDADLSAWAELVRSDCLRHFSVIRRGKPMFAYLTDLQGNHTCYHDANDLPTLLAPVWGFCKEDDPLWTHTMDFAFSDANVGGYYEGTFGGLGSVHTPHPWPLGDAQELLYSYIRRDRTRFAGVMRKLEAIVQWDGMFPEAVCEEKRESRIPPLVFMAGGVFGEGVPHNRFIAGGRRRVKIVIAHTRER